MATLTAEQITYIRETSGDNCTPYYVSDEFMQWLYDNKAGSDDCALIVHILRVMDAKTAPLTNEGSDGQSKSLSQKHQQIRALRAEWEERCGMAGPALGMSAIDLNIDTDCENEDDYLSRLEQYQ